MPSGLPLVHSHPISVVEPGGASVTPASVRDKVRPGRKSFWCKVCLQPHLGQGGTPLVEKISLFVSSCCLREIKMSGTCSRFPLFGDPWPSCLLPSQLCNLWFAKSQPQLSKFHFHFNIGTECRRREMSRRDYDGHPFLETP